MPYKKRGGVPKTRRAFISIAPAYRSTSERKVADALRQKGVSPGYESETLEYVMPATKHRYIPDFPLDNGVYLEVKGYWPADQRQKMVQVIKANPDADIRMVLDTPDKTISKTSKTTYAKFCDKQGIKWAKTGAIPDEWLTGCHINPDLIKP